MNYAWPSAEIAVMGPEGAVDIVYKRELDAVRTAAADRSVRSCGRRRLRSSGTGLLILILLQMGDFWMP